MMPECLAICLALKPCKGKTLGNANDLEFPMLNDQSSKFGTHKNDGGILLEDRFPDRSLFLVVNFFCWETGCKCNLCRVLQGYEVRGEGRG